MSEKATKITAEELENVQSLQKEVNNLLLNIGNAEIVKAQLIGKHSKMQEDWNALTASLEEKYGSVNISLEDGTLSEIEQKDNVEDAVVEEA
tara:strand:+ start:1992 stop:2267 length:276 start_codon:yes stop_codon:yes gene_type:complete